MNKDQLVMIGAAFLLIAAATISAMRSWFPGRVGTVVYSLAGLGVIVLLWLAEMPPDWFDGSASSFGLAITLMLWAFVLREAKEKAFGRPFLMSMGLALVAFNVWAHV